MAQFAGNIARGLRSEGVARRGAIVLLVVFLTPLVLIAAGWVISLL